MPGAGMCVSRFGLLSFKNESQKSDSEKILSLKSTKESTPEIDRRNRPEKPTPRVNPENFDLEN
jgi:hypothetical protein